MNRQSARDLLFNKRLLPDGFSGGIIDKFLAVARWLLLPFGIVHLAVVWLRNRLYDRRLLRVRQLPVPVVSLGNVQMGGTGKSQLALELAQSLEARGYRVGLLSRGYRRSGSGTVILDCRQKTEETPAAHAGDEPAMLYRRLKNAVIGVGADRYQTANVLLKSAAVDIFLLDDGFQHRRLHRDVDICLIDGERWEDHPFLFPFSALRDMKASLRRADVMVVTRSQTALDEQPSFEKMLQQEYDVPVLAGRYEITALLNARTGEAFPREMLQELPVMAVCAIAAPQRFISMLRDAGVRLAATRSFRDHHPFTTRDVAAIREIARREGIGHILITAKDAVKLADIINGEAGEALFITVQVRFVIDAFERLLAPINALLPSTSTGP